MDIGNNLRVIRSKQNISQNEVADFLGVDRKTYVRWENGEADVKGVYFPKLAEFLNVEVSDLLKDRAGDIIINQHNPDYKDHSTNNSIVLIVNDRDTVNQIMEIVKKRVESQ